MGAGARPSGEVAECTRQPMPPPSVSLPRPARRESSRSWHRPRLPKCATAWPARCHLLRCRCLGLQGGTPVTAGTRPHAFWPTSLAASPRPPLAPRGVGDCRLSPEVPPRPCVSPAPPHGGWGRRWCARWCPLEVPAWLRREGPTSCILGPVGSVQGRPSPRTPRNAGCCSSGAVRLIPLGAAAAPLAAPAVQRPPMTRG